MRLNKNGATELTYIALEWQKWIFLCVCVQNLVMNFRLHILLPNNHTFGAVPHAHKNTSPEVFSENTKKKYSS